MKIENSTCKFGSLKLGFLYRKMLEYGVAELQEIKVHAELKQLVLLWEVVINDEQSYTKHIITLCGQNGKCFLVQKQVVHNSNRRVIRHIQNLSWRTD